MERHQGANRPLGKMGLRLGERELGAVIRRSGVHRRDVSRAGAGGIISGGGNGFRERLRAGALAAAEFENAGAGADGGAPGVDEIDAVDGLAAFDG